MRCNLRKALDTVYTVAQLSRFLRDQNGVGMREISKLSRLISSFFIAVFLFKWLFQCFI